MAQARHKNNPCLGCHAIGASWDTADVRSVAVTTASHRDVASKRPARRVLSRTGARMLIVTRGGFEAMVRATSYPVAIAGLPEQVQPTRAMQTQLMHRRALRNIEMLGPPIA